MRKFVFQTNPKDLDMEIIDFGAQNSLVGVYLSQMRDVEIQKDPLRFRRNLERVGEIMAYEISKTLRYKALDVTTPLGKSVCMVPDEQVVLATIFRAGVPFHQGFLNFFDGAENAFVSAYRKYKEKENFDVCIEYLASPRLEGKTLIICDPMLATGGSADAAITEMKKRGCHNIKLMVLVAAPEGIEHLQKVHPDVDIYAGAVDDHLNEHGYIVPGLGDAGDRIFGTK